MNENHSRRTAHQTLDPKSKQLDAKLKCLESLSLIQQTAMASHDQVVTAIVLLEQLHENYGVDAAAFWSFDQQTNTLELTSWYGKGTSPKPEPINDLTIGLPGKALHTKKPVHLSPTLKASAFSRKSMIEGRNFTAYLAVKLIYEARIIGVIEVYNKDHHVQNEGWQENVTAFCQKCALTLNLVASFNKVNQANQFLRKALEETILSYANSLDLHEHKMTGHATNLAQIATNLARDLNFPEQKIIAIQRGALLHDLGNIIISDDIFMKSGPLNEQEWECIREHTQTGYDFLKEIDYLKPSIDILLSHHERWDGKGYPRGLQGQQIPLNARIFSVADTWESLRSQRPYRPPFSRTATLEYIEQQSGLAFDPEIVKIFLDNPPSEFQAEQKKKPSLLIVDDEEKVTKSLARSLRSDFEVVTVNSAKEALRVMEKQTFQIVLTDQRMPDMTGIELLRQIKKRYPASAGLLLSAYLDSAVLAEAINLGNVFGFVGKPWSDADLQKRLVLASSMIR